jgi:hypothetical protein
MPKTNVTQQISRDYWNHTRFVTGDNSGHYESFFQRANHLTRPLAFWIRYTIFSPKGRLAETVGELWAVYFDGESKKITAAKQVYPIQQCEFSRTGLGVRIGETTLVNGALQGQVSSGKESLRWLLEYSSDQAPLLLLPVSFYESGFPKAKALVGSPGALFRGMMNVNGKEVEIDGWLGSQNHNWGSKHTDRYAWGQVAGFDNAREAFLELSTAQVRIGPVWLPWMTLIVLRLGDEEYSLNGLLQAVSAHGQFDYGKGKTFSWQFDSQVGGVRIHGMISAPSSSFVGLRYDNPPGGSKICLNTKLASCEVNLERSGNIPCRLNTENRAAFEILTEEGDHGIEVVA